MLGKYSPTVSWSYSKDQDWFKKYSKGELYDHDGYDSYGYNKSGSDRNGYSQNDYLNDESLYADVYEHFYDTFIPSMTSIFEL